jgi:hypothetical protein
MRNRVCRSLLGALLSLASCGDPNDNRQTPSGDAGVMTGGAGGVSTGDCPSDLPKSADCSSLTPSYASDVSPLISEHCLPCHFAGNTLSSVVLTDQPSVFKNRSVELTQVYRCNMPPSGATPLSAAERQLLLQYLVCNAPNN